MIIKVKGDDALPFLQRLLTIDIIKLYDKPQRAALLSPQGKILFLFWIWLEDTYCIYIEPQFIEGFIDKLLVYKLSAKVDIETSHKEFIDYNQKYYITNAIARMDIDINSNEVYPHDINLDAIGGVSFTKGCFIGQEVIARIQHKAVLKKRLAIVQSQQTGDILADDKVIGKLRYIYNNKGLAIIKINELSQKLFIADTEVKVTLPKYLFTI